MNKNDVLKDLADKIKIFADETNAMFENGSDQPATKADLAALSNEMYYAFSAVESALKSII